MKTRLLLFLITLTHLSIAQNKLQSFEKSQYNINRNGMFVLGSWGVANITTGLIGRANTGGTSHYFHEMNIGWGGVNTTLAAISFFSKPKDTLVSLDRLKRKQTQLERVFLINAGLDVVYVSAGALLIHAGNKPAQTNERFIGYGNSLVMQGGFLFLFDGFMYCIHKQHGKHMPILAKTTIGYVPNGLYISYHF